MLQPKRKKRKLDEGDGKLSIDTNEEDDLALLKKVSSGEDQLLLYSNCF